jgi:hypothetical protein
MDSVELIKHRLLVLEEIKHFKKWIDDENRRDFIGHDW